MLVRGTVLLISVVVAVVLLEVMLRIAPLVAPEPTRSFILEAARFRLSNVRMYPRGVAVRLPADESADVVVVGDSFPFGLYETQRDAYPSRLGELLGKRVINLGVVTAFPPRYNRMVEVGTRYRPRMVVYALFANDLADLVSGRPRRLTQDNASRALDGDRDLFFTQYDTRGALLNTVRAFSNQSVGYAIFKILLNPPPGDFVGSPWWHGEHFFVLAERRYWDPILTWDSRAVQNAVALNVAFTVEAHRYAVGTLDAKFVVLLQPSKEMVYGPFTGELQLRVYSASWDRTYEELQTLLLKSGVPVLDLTDELRRHAQAGAKLYHSIDGHFNQQGHQTVAEILSREIGPLLDAGAPQSH